MKGWMIIGAATLVLSACAMPRQTVAFDQCTTDDGPWTGQRIYDCEHELASRYCPPVDGLHDLLTGETEACRADIGKREQVLAQAKARAAAETQERQYQETQRVEAVRQHPSPAFVAYEKKVAPLYRDMGITMMALGCQIRSPMWVSSLNYGLQLNIGGVALNSGLSNDEKKAAQLDGNKMQADARDEFGFPHDHCRRLVNSPELARLDEMQWRLSGGYH